LQICGSDRLGVRTMMKDWRQAVGFLLGLWLAFHFLMPVLER
jgi:hypothetical protein